MDEVRLSAALSGLLGRQLAQELVSDFVKIRQDYATKTLERASPGKFVETLVQCLQYISTGRYDAKPRVDAYLDREVERTRLPEGLRVCAARVGRSMYTLRNKRNIAHKGEVDPNTSDLGVLHAQATWVMTELLRHATGLPVQEAAKLIELLQVPVGTLVEEIDGTRLVHADTSARAELLILLHSHYPCTVPTRDILASLSRRKARTVGNRIRELYAEKLVQGDPKAGYRLTRAGHTAAVTEIEKLTR